MLPHRCQILRLVSKTPDQYRVTQCCCHICSVTNRPRYANLIITPELGIEHTTVISHSNVLTIQAIGILRIAKGLTVTKNYCSENIFLLTFSKKCSLRYLIVLEGNEHIIIWIVSQFPVSTVPQSRVDIMMSDIVCHMCVLSTVPGIKVQIR